MKSEELAEVHQTLSTWVGSEYKTTVEIVRRRSGENHHMISATDDTCNGMNDHHTCLAVVKWRNLASCLAMIGNILSGCQVCD